MEISLLTLVFKFLPALEIAVLEELAPRFIELCLPCPRGSKQETLVVAGQPPYYNTYQSNNIRREHKLIEFVLRAKITFEMKMSR